MVGTVKDGLTLSGHTGSDPNNTVAMYRCAYADNTASCAVLNQGGDQGYVETQALGHLWLALAKKSRNGD